MARAMLTDFRTLRPRDSLGRAVELILRGSQHNFPVVENGNVLGVLTRGHLQITLARRGQETPVVDVMRRDLQTVDSSEMLQTAFARLQTCDCHSLPVVHGGQLVGLVTMDNVGEFVAIQAAFVQRRAEGSNKHEDHSELYFLPMAIR